MAGRGAGPASEARDDEAEEIGALVRAGDVDAAHRAASRLAASRGSALGPRALSLAATCRTLALGRRGDWAGVFAPLARGHRSGVDAGATDLPSLRRAFRALALLSHPDKSAWAAAGGAREGAAEAFALLQRGAEALSRRFGRGRSPGGRRRSASSDDSRGAGGGAWWEEWDDWSVTRGWRSRGRGAPSPARRGARDDREARLMREFEGRVGGMGRPDLVSEVCRLRAAVVGALGGKSVTGEEDGEGERGAEAVPAAVLRRQLQRARELLSAASRGGGEGSGSGSGGGAGGGAGAGGFLRSD